MGYREYFALFLSYIRVLILRLYKGIYSRWVGLFIGILSTLILAIIGFVIGPWIGGPVWNFLQLPSFDFKHSELTVLWGVHATIIAFSLVGLSFGWNSIRDLQTDTDIIAEIAQRLRSIETISFLLSSNLLIGIAILRLADTSIPYRLSVPVGLLFIFSLILTLHRFWLVLDLLLYDSLDNKIITLARNHLSGDFHSPVGDFDSYLGHFFDASRREIDEDRPDKLRENLRKVEELLELLLEADQTTATDGQLWDFVYSSYDSLYRRCLNHNNDELEKQVIASLSGVYWITLNHWRNQGQ